MALHKDQAIVLSTRVYGESDKIIRFFTLGSGKITGIAKGGKKSQKRFMNTLELFNCIRIEYFEKPQQSMVRIDNADLEEHNSGIESSFRRMCIASFITEFVDKLTREKERNEALFYELQKTLTKLKSVEFTASDVLYYQLQMLGYLGYMPNLKTCVQCGRDLASSEKTCFSNQRGGTVCPECSRSVPHRVYPDGLISRLSDPHAGSLLDNRTFERHGREILEAFISFHLNTEFKSYRLLKSVVSG
jgi:DNA repair protein RecO (recombination protein O)